LPYSTDIERLCKQLQSKSSHVSIYYEAGPCSYGLYLPNSFSLATAQDDALSGNVKINGIYRGKAIRSEVDILLVGQAGTEIINGYVRDDNNTVWNLVVHNVHGQVLVTEACTVDGTIPAAYRPGNPERERVTTW